MLIFLPLWCGVGVRDAIMGSGKVRATTKETSRPNILISTKESMIKVFKGELSLYKSAFVDRDT